MPANLTFEPDTHVYRYRGGVIPGVTNVLTNAKIIELPPFNDARVARKAMVGRDVHTICSRIALLGDQLLDEVDDEVAGYVRGYKKFIAATNADWSLVEARVLIERNGLRAGGTLDIAGLLFRRDWWLIDIKTPIQHKAHWGLQTAGYALGLKPPITRPWKWRRGALMLRPDSKYRLVEHTDASDFDVFLAALENPYHPAVLQWKKNHGMEVLEEDEAYEPVS